MKESYRNHTTGNAGLSKVRLVQSQIMLYAAKRTRLQLRPFFQLVHFAPTGTWLREGD
jgi:hypothetical protein